MTAPSTPRMNRTSTKLQPNLTKEMIEAPSLFPPDTAGDELQIASLRERYMAEGEPIGSIPLPLTPKGVLESAKGLLKAQQPLVFLDKLGERLAFERTGPRLYQAFLGKVMAEGAPQRVIPVELVQHQLEEEARHFMMIHGAIEQLGGDPTAVTPAADVIGVASSGLLQVVSDPRTTVDQCLCAMLTAELVDNDGWPLLIQLAESLGHRDLAAEFSTALQNEEQHLTTVRNWVNVLTMEMAGADRR